MYIVNGITDDANQTQGLYLPDGSIITLDLLYIPMQLGWFMNLTYGAFILNSYRVNTNNNMLQQYVNQLPFGMACYTSDESEPTQQQDFISGYAILYVLTPAEVLAYSEALNGG
jgi:hypothetical protein